MPTYWPTDSNKTPDLLDFFVINGISSEYMKVEPSYDLSSDHSPVIATVCSYAIHKTPRSKLHNQKTNCEEYRMKLQEEINLNVRLKSPMEIDCTLISLINIIKQATQNATPTPKISLQNKTRNVSIEIKKLRAEKRRARASITSLLYLHFALYNSDFLAARYLFYPGRFLICYCTF
jgi:hypothetical protein